MNNYSHNYVSLNLQSPQYLRASTCQPAWLNLAVQNQQRFFTATTAPASNCYHSAGDGYCQNLSEFNDNYQSQITEDTANPLYLHKTRHQNVHAKVFWINNHTTTAVQSEAVFTLKTKHYCY